MLPPSFFFIFSSSFPFFLPPIKPAPSAPRTWTCPFTAMGKCTTWERLWGSSSTLLCSQVCTGAVRLCSMQGAGAALPCTAALRLLLP